MFNIVLEICISFWQFFISIATAPEFDPPDAWKDPLYYVRVMNLDIVFLRDIIPALNDFRLYFLIVAVGIPVLFVFIGVIFLNRLRVIMWYTALITSVCLIMVGVLAIIFAANGSLVVSIRVGMICLFVGIPLAIVCAILFCLRDRLLACGTNVEEIANAKTVEERMAAETRDFPVVVFILRVVTFLVLLGLAALMLGFIQFQDATSGIEDFSLILGIIFCVLAAVVLIWMIIGLPQCGREGQWKIMNVVANVFMRLFLISMSLAFIPVGSAVFQMFNCNEFNCPAGYRHIDEGSRFPYDTHSNVSAFCMPCNFDPSNSCPSAYLQRTVCGGGNIERLEADRTIACEDLQRFFWPAAFLIIIVFMLGVPILFQQMISVTSAMMMDAFPVKVRVEDDEHVPDEDALWQAKVLASENNARFLYQPFVPHLRYTRLYQLCQKLLIVFTAVFIIRIGDGTTVPPVMIALVAALVIHFLGMVWLIVRRPFIYTFENRLSVAMEVMLIIAAIVAICIVQSVDVPNWVLILIIVLNGVLPIVALVIGVILEWSSRKTAEEEAAQEMQEAMQNAVEQNQQEEDLDMAVQLQAEEHRAYQEQQRQTADGATPPPPGVVADDHQRTTTPPPQPGATTTGAGAVVAVGASKSTGKTKDEEEKERKRRKLAEIQRRVEKELEEENEELRMQQANMDLQINEEVNLRLNAFLMVGGLICFIALGLCVVGLLETEETSTKTFGDHQRTVATEFAGHPDWGNFTEDCCCIYSSVNRSDLSLTALTVEKWICANGHTKDRLRERRLPDGTIQNGFSIRPLCSATFNSLCTLTIDSSSQIALEKPVEVTCPTPSVMPDDEATRLLW